VEKIDVPEEQRVSPPHTPKPILLEGVQRVAKFNKTELDNVKIYLALYRLSEIPHDIVFTLNMPMTDSIDDQGLQIIKEMFRSIASSLIIEDFALFGAE
jgi:Ran-interacting Mog1 protein